MSHHQYIPTLLRHKEIIHSIWQVDHFTAFGKEYIVPKGIVEIIFNFSGDHSLLAQMNGNNYDLPFCFINGFNTSPIQLQLPIQQVFLGVIFQPLAIKKFFRTPASEFSDMLVDLSLLDANCLSLWHQLAEQKTFNERVNVLLAWVSSRLIEWQPQEQLINHFLYADRQHDMTVTELANAMCYSPRHLSRKIMEATGMNAEEILLYKKYLQAVHLIHHTNLPLTDIAYQSQFFDQSHFIRSFKAYANITPGEYRRSKSLVKGHLYKDVR